MAKTALITGGNRGLGLETARQLAREHNFKIIVGSGDQTRGQEAEDLLRSEGFDVRFILLDVTDENSIIQAASQIDAVDVLINNAGIMLEHEFQVGGIPNRGLEANLRGQSIWGGFRD